MPINITMPALSPTMEEGNLAKWLVKEGDKVSSGDVIAEIETDKATMEVEAVDEGTVAKLVVPAGTEGVKVNALIAILAGEGEDAAAAAKSGGDAPAKAEAPKAEAPKAEPAKAEAPKTAASPAPAAKAESAPRRRTDMPPASAPSPRRWRGALPRRPASSVGRDRLRSAWPRGQGRCRGGDCRRRRQGARRRRQQAQPRRRRKAMSDDAVLKLFEEGSYELVPHDNMRKTIARRLVEAKSTIPHFYLTIDCDLDALLKLRGELNAAAPMKKTEKGEVPAYKLSVNDMIIKAMALALRDVPTANVSWTETAMVSTRPSMSGVAVSIPGGLITPIIRHADTKTLSAISNEMKDLAARARNKKLKPEEYQGGTDGGFQSRHVRRQGLRRGHQPAACDHPGGRRRRAARGGQERRDQDRHHDVGDAVDRSPRRRRRARRRTDGRLQALYRESDGDAGLSRLCLTMEGIGNGYDCTSSW